MKSSPKQLAQKAQIAFRRRGLSGLVKEGWFYFLNQLNPPIKRAAAKTDPYPSFPVLRTGAKTVKYNLNFDDLVPGNSSLVLLKKLVRLFPQIKITLFVPINSREAKDTDLFDHPDWCRQIARLPRKNFEIGVHGYFHHLDDWHKTPEFKYLSEKEAEALLLRCEQAFAKMGLKFIKGFRPPRWEISEGTQKALEKRHYLFLADTPRFYAEHQSIKIPRLFVNSDIRENADHDEIRSYQSLLPDPEEFCFQRGHLLSYCDNSLTPETFANIVRTIKSLPKVEFKFLSEIAREII